MHILTLLSILRMHLRRILNNKNINFVYGINNVLAVLESNKYFIDSIKIMNNSTAIGNTQLNNSLLGFNTCIEYLDKKSFISLYNYKHTQGIIVFFSGNLLSDFNSIDLNRSNKNICYIIIDQITDPQNLGQIIRTCECAGVDGIILPKHGSVHMTNTVLQVSQGAFTNVDIYMVTNLTTTMKFLKENGFWITGMENSINASKWHDIDYTKKVGIVFGSESKGIRELVKKTCDFMATIPMQGKINSLNVSASISSILFERLRQINIKEK